MAPADPYRPPADPYRPPAEPGAEEPPVAGEVLEDAKKAFRVAFLSFFCFGIVLGPLAIRNGLAARRVIEDTPGLLGWGRANAAIVLGCTSCALWLLGFAERAAS